MSKQPHSSSADDFESKILPDVLANIELVEGRPAEVVPIEPPHQAEIRVRLVPPERDDGLLGSKKFADAQLQRLRQLTFRRLLQVEDPHLLWSDISQMQHLYDRHLIPDDTLRDFIAGESDALVESGAAGFVDRFKPYKTERSSFDHYYRSPYEHAVQDSAITSTAPYEYVVYGLMNPSKKLVASLTMKLPPTPEDPEVEIRTEQYRNYILNSLSLTCDRQRIDVAGRLSSMQFMAHWEVGKTLRQIQSSPVDVWEFDTICKDDEYPGAGLLIIAKMLNDIYNRYGRLPKNFFTSYLAGLISSDSEDNTLRAEFPNEPSRKLLTKKLAGVEMANRFTGDEVLARKIDGKVHRFRQSVNYVQLQSKYMVPRLEKTMKERGILGPDGSVFSEGITLE